jgi:phosphoglycolate phosphatase
MDGPLNGVMDGALARAASRRLPTDWRAMLFDLDGTLADTAPDLAGAVNAMRVDRSLEAMPLEQLRPMASHGARGLLQVAFGKSPDDADYEALRVEFLQRYEDALMVHSRLFDGVPEVLDALEARGLAWGIVTNKAMRFTTPLAGLMGLASRAGIIVGGDTTPFAKPHPAPLLHAAEALDIPASACIYVGDDLRDIVAGKAAGMHTIAAAWGYCGRSGPATWDADLVLDDPRELMTLLKA